MFHNQLPEKWYIKRNPKNCRVVNYLFRKINGKKYTGTGTSKWGNTDYLHYPAIKNNRFQSIFPKWNYQEISVEQLKNYIMSKESKKIMDKLPENWHIIITDSILEDAFQWRFNRSRVEFNFPYFKPGCIVGMYNWDNHYSKEWKRASEPSDHRWGQEISEEDFRFHVLKKYTREDWIEGRIALLKSKVKDRLLDAFLKECNPRNSSLICFSGLSDKRYLVANMDERVIKSEGKGFWKPLSTTDLPIVDDVKKLYANENIMKNAEKEVIGYELIRPEYKQVAMKALGLSNRDSYTPFIVTGMISHYLPKIQELGIEEWFEPVYKPEIKLPLINGYNGEDLGESIQYGCAVLEKVWFTTSNNRHIKELTLSSNVKINELQMKEIRKYLQSVKK